MRFSQILCFLLICSSAIGGAAAATDSDHDYAAPAPGTYALPVIKTAADGDVLDANGRRLRLREVTQGKITVLSFIYTRCAAVKACPYATGVLNELHELSQTNKTLAKTMRLVSMSFDPAVDSPQRMADYSAWLRTRPGGAEWRFLTTRSRAELQPILAAYDQAVDTRPNPADPQGPLFHTLRVYLIDSEGRIRNIYSSGTLDVRLVLADIQTLSLPGSNKDLGSLNSSPSNPR